MNTRTYTYSSHVPLPVEETSKRVRRWARRRIYVHAVKVTAHRVTVTLDHIPTDEHNRAVNHLSRILDRLFDQALLNPVS